MLRILAFFLLVSLGLALWLGALGLVVPGPAWALQPEANSADPPSRLDVQPSYLAARLQLDATGAQTLSVANVGVALPLTYSVFVLPFGPLAGIVPWLSVSPGSGTLAPGARATVEVTFNADQEVLVEPLNMATLWVSSDAVSEPITVQVPVLLEVNPLLVQPNPLSVDLPPGQRAERVLTLTNALYPSLVFSLTVAGQPAPPAWLDVSPFGGPLAGGESCLLTAGLDAGGLAPGLYRADLVLENDVVLDFPLTVPLTLTVGPWRAYLPLALRAGEAGTFTLP